jgi:hypothetical protein
LENKKSVTRISLIFSDGLILDLTISTYIILSISNVHFRFQSQSLPIVVLSFALLSHLILELGSIALLSEILDGTSDTMAPFRSTRVLPSEFAQGPACETLELVESDSYGSKKVFEVVRPVPKERLQCSISKPTKDDFVDEGYFSPSPTDSETKFFCGSVQYSEQPEIEKAPQTPRIAINDILLQLPQISVTDENGETEIIAPDDDEHGQLWNFARDKIARRMFLIRADRRTQHMESTFYSDLYPVKNPSGCGSAVGN